MLILGIGGRKRVISRLGVAAVVVATMLVGGGAASGASSTTDASASYLVVYKADASTQGAAGAVARAGGELVATYAPIGVVVAKSSNPSFAASMKADKAVEGAVATKGFGTRLVDATDQGGAVPLNGATWGDSLSGLQWDMTQINVPQAHAITTGSDSVLVADVDTGLDFTHPDLAPAYDAAASTDCSSGAPQPLAVGNDRNGHGTHTAGTIAAAANGIGIVGVAPGVRLAGIKSSNDDGFFFPEMVVCAYMWAATHGVDVTNNSYFVDPWLYNCKNDPVQRAIWTAERRAIRFAQSNGVLVVASEGNEADDLSHPTTDMTSPDFPPGSTVTREITNACSVIPVEVPGVVGVTATGSLQQKSFYSSYGISTADVAAPGGDSILQRTPQAPNGRVLSTFSSVGTICAPIRLVVENGAKYCFLQGTSMAGPHAVGVAALIASVTGKSGGALGAALQNAVNPIACPTDLSLYAFFPQQDSGLPQACQGGLQHNSWYGAGEVDALKAVR